MIGRLRRGQMLELPLLSAPVEFAPQLVSQASKSARYASQSGAYRADFDEVLFAAPDVRRRVLDDLIDSGVVDSPELRDDVVFLVRSLGGIAHGEPLEIELPGEGRPMRSVDSIETAGEAETVCIQVAAADSLYVTDDFLVTHNTLNASFIILDEAQNTTPEQMKMFLTRIGFGSKAVVTGDTTQVDVPGGRSGLSGLEQVLAGIDGLGFVHLSSKDVVRHRIVQEIVDAYERAGAPNPAQR
jgi:phosphate starvation-inducible PhoH-like protein